MPGKADIKNIDAKELVVILGKLGRIAADVSELAKAVTPDRVARIMLDLDELRIAVKRALES